MTIDDAIAAYETGGTVTLAEIARSEASWRLERAEASRRAITKEPRDTIQRYIKSRLGRRGLTGVGVQCYALVHNPKQTSILLVTVDIPLRGSGRLVDQWTSDRVETLSEWCARIGRIGADMMKPPERRADG